MAATRDQAARAIRPDAESAEGDASGHASSGLEQLRHVAEEAKRHAPDAPTATPGEQPAAAVATATPAAPRSPAHLGNDDVVTWAVQQRLGFPTGTRFEYCDTNYVLLARVLEVAGKRRFAELLAAEVLRPLGMTSVVLDQARVIPERAQGYQRAGRGWTPVRDDVPVTGDGNLFASLDDLQRWDRGLSTLLPPDDLAALLTPGQLDSGTAHDYALGWTIGGEPDHRVADYSGAWTGTATYIARHLDDNTSNRKNDTFEQFLDREYLLYSKKKAPSYYRRGPSFFHL